MAVPAMVLNIPALSIHQKKPFVFFCFRGKNQPVFLFTGSLPSVALREGWWVHP
jgi:hypothetical protein